VSSEAKKYGKVNVVATGDNKSVPDPSSWKLSPGDRDLQHTALACDSVPNLHVAHVDFR
jgi:hypothetical protein